MIRQLFVFAIIFSVGTSANAQRKAKSYPPSFGKAAKTEVYKTIGDVKLNVYIFNPADHKPTDARPAAVFFFGGGWKSGTPGQFEQQCKYLASRGMVAMTADYRVASRHETKAKECVADAKSAIRWIRQNAKRLGVDPNRVVAGGGSAGGHIAACTGTITGFDEESEDQAISSIPSAMALFNPALVLAPIQGKQLIDSAKAKTLPARMGTDPKNLSPFHHVKKGQPPTIIFHGEADTTVPFKTARVFSEAMKTAGNRCELIAFPGEPHGFFNYGRNNNVAYDKTIQHLDRFLTSLGYLPAER